MWRGEVSVISGTSVCDSCHELPRGAVHETHEGPGDLTRAAEQGAENQSAAVQSGTMRSATSDDFPGTEFSTVVLSRSWK